MPTSLRWTENAVNVILEYMPGMPPDNIDAALEFVSDLKKVPKTNRSTNITLTNIQSELLKRRGA
jgi:hypothetical protein